MKRRNGKIILGLCMSMSMLCNACAFLPEEGEVQKAPLVETQAPYEFEMDVVQRETLYDTVALWGKYIETSGDKLSFGGSGVVGKIYAEVGDEVKTGDVIAEYNYVSSLKEELERLQETIDNEQKQYDQLLYQKDFDTRELQVKKKYGILSKSEYATQLAQLEKRYQNQMQPLEDSLYIYNLKAEQLLTQIQNGSVIATMDGVVSSLTNLEVGRYVTSSREVVHLVDKSVGMFEIKSDYADHFQVGDEIVLTTNSSVSYETVVDSIQDNCVYFRPTSQDVVISMNTQIKYDLILNQRDNVLTLSYSCVRYTAVSPYVYYINEDGVRSMKLVKVGIQGGTAVGAAKTRIEIVDGLELGEIVIKK